MPTPTDIDETQPVAQPGESSAGPYAEGQSPQDLATLAAARQALQNIQAARGQGMSTSNAPATAPQIAPQAQGTIDDLTSSPPPESWASKAYHGILTGLGGKYDTQFIPTPNGVVQQQVAQTPGQQWKRIISGAITGVGAAAQAGTQGPGGAMRGLGAGITAGYGQRVAEGENQERQANTQFTQQQEAAMNTARKSLMASQVAEANWNLSYKQAEASKANLALEANQQKMLEDAKEDGAIDLGVKPTFQDAVDDFNRDPTLHDKHGQGQLIPVGHVDGDNKINGVHVIWVPKAWQDKRATEDYTYENLKAYDAKGDPIYEPMTVGKSTGMTNGQLQDFKMAHSLQVAKYQNDAIESKARQTQAESQAALVPSEKAKNWAEAENARAEASDRLFASGTTPESQQVIDAIGTGHVTVQRLGQLLSKPEGQRLLANVMTKYPDFDQSKVAGYIHAVQDYTDSKLGTAGGNLRTVGGAIMQLQRISDANTPASLIYGTPANTAYKDLVHNAAPEIAKFYGTSTKEGIEKIESELLSRTPWNRNAALKAQTQAVGDVIDQYDQTWRNAAPSARYEAPMPGISQDVKDARAKLDPEYAQRQAAGGTVAPVAPGAITPQPGLPKIQPGETVKYDTRPGHEGEPWVQRGGQWTQAQP